MGAEIHAFPPTAERAEVAEVLVLYRHWHLLLVGLSLASWAIVLAVGKLIIALI